MRIRLWGAVLPGLLLLVVGNMPSLPVVAAGDPIVFSTAPTQSPQRTREMYQPLADHLSQVIGREVVLRPERLFLSYTNKMREDEYDLLFDGPHFASWRMRELGHSMVAKLPGSIVFVVAVREDARVREISDLAGKRVCSFASPNLLTLGFLNLFPNPARQPIMIKTPTFKGALDCARNGQGLAAVMRDKFWEKRPPEQTEGLRLIHTSPTPYPHRVFSVSDSVDAATRERIRKALVGDRAAQAGRAVLKRFRVNAFVQAGDDEYEGFADLLRPVWGFH